MKAVDLAKVAAAAEGLRLKRQLMRYGRQVAYLVLAGVFGLFALITAHVVLWTLCDGPWHFGIVWSSVAVFGFDLLIALILVLLGRSKQPGPLEIEARITRDRTLAELRSAVAFTAVTAAVTGPAGRFAGRSLWGALRKIKPSGRRNR